MAKEIGMLRLIKLVNDNKAHISELDTLAKIVDKDYEVVVKTTINAHYDFKLYLDDKFKNPMNTVDKQLEALNKEEFDKLNNCNYKEKYYNMLDEKVH